MTTIVQCLPQWLRNRFKRPRRATVLCKKQRQVLPTLPHPKRSAPVCQEDHLKIESPGDGEGTFSATDFIGNKGEEGECIESDSADRAGEQVSPERASDATLPADSRLNSSTSKFLAALYYWVISRR